MNKIFDGTLDDFAKLKLKDEGSGSTPLPSNPKSKKKKYEIILGAFHYDQFVWHHVGAYDILEGDDGAYKAFKAYVNSQLKYTDEELKKVWDSGRLDIELREGTKLLNWVGVYARAAVTDENDNEDNDKEPGDPDKEDKKEEKPKKDSLPVGDALAACRITLVKQKDENGEYSVRYFIAGKHNKQDDYVTDDWNEALDVFMDEAKRMGYTIFNRSNVSYIATRSGQVHRT
jgi:hypothetical protein